VQIFSSFFYTCILQGAIDFAELPILARQGVAGFAPKPTFSRATSQPTTQLFLQCILQAAIDFAVLRMRSWRSKWLGGRIY